MIIYSRQTTTSRRWCWRTIFAISETHNGATRTRSASALEPRTASIIELKPRANFQSFTSPPEREIWSLLCHCSPGGISFAYLLCFYFNHAEIWKNSKFNAFTLTFDVTKRIHRLHFLYLNLWFCNFAPLKLIPRNLISSFNSLTCFRIVDDNLIANKPQNFEAFVTCQEGNP